MRSRARRKTLIAVGIATLLVEVVFAGQGANLIPGSSMTGDRTWLDVGLALALVGVVPLVGGIRRRGTSS
ncbi:hypothetical protein [Herbiconiux ginsengi]|uniref:Uncharacterized protein n=1 Tax=Herbiconiux ginsengi TaxID=381665 RepID=A0A1H3QS64_9MICO|nr:hypothetical protein [Herbiconiux ginsengi]SDZ15845.1 hypothetical protein SAMN05216554_2692 [Herbiconiux ginsengi]